MRLKSFVLVLAALFSLSACVTTPTPEQLASADYGEYPQNYKSIVQDHLKKTLKDPYSAKVEYLNEPTKQWHAAFGREPQYGYVVCANVNAKNSYGAYVGEKLNIFLIKNGDIIAAKGNDSVQQKPESCN